MNIFLKYFSLKSIQSSNPILQIVYSVLCFNFHNLLIIIIFAFVNVSVCKILKSFFLSLLNPTSK